MLGGITNATHEHAGGSKSGEVFPRFTSAFIAKNDLLRRKLTFRLQH
jgi:hypothetical protein